MARIPDPPEHLERLKNNLTTFIKKVLEPKSISENEDLNDYTEVGMYYCKSYDIAVTLSNCPVDNSFSLFVEKSNDNDGNSVQILTSFNGTYVRRYVRFSQNYDGTFQNSGWQPIYEDTGWKDVTFSSGFTHHSETDRVRYRRVGKVVELRGAVKNTNQISANTSTTIATISDTTCRPSKRVTYRQQGSSMNTFAISINTTGTIAVNMYGTTSGIAIPSGSWLNVHTTFLVD